LNERFLEQQQNRLADLLPSAASWSNALRVIDASACAPGGLICLNVDSMTQRAVCYWEPRS
jgi:hypothetical protein